MSVSVEVVVSVSAEVVASVFYQNDNLLRYRNYNISPAHSSYHHFLRLSFHLIVALGCEFLYLIGMKNQNFSDKPIYNW